jgi:Flp pilus assembly protein TadG
VGRERGSVTAEMAVALLAIMLVVLAIAGVVSVGLAMIRCQDAAREGTRAAARSEPPGAVQQVARQAAPAGSTVAVSTADDQITVTVRASVHILGGLLPAVPVTAQATSLREPAAEVTP